MERELVERARRGDHDAFAVLAAATIDRLDSTARLILGDPDLAKDAVQEALFRAWRELPTLRDPDRFQSWLRRTLVRACFGEGRKRRRIRVEVELDLDRGPAHRVMARPRSSSATLSTEPSTASPPRREP